MRKIFSKLFVISILSLVSACASVTEIEGSWKKAGTVAQKYNKIVVLGLANDLAKRSTVETSIVNDLIKNGYNAVAGSAVLPTNVIDVNSDGKLDAGVKEQIVSQLKAAGIDGALVFALNDIQKSTQYVPGTVSYTPPVGMYRFGGYYGGMYDNMYGVGGYTQTPGYYVENTNYVMTTNFYNVANETLLWSTQSGTMSPSSLADFSASYGDAVVKAFIASGIVSK